MATPAELLTQLATAIETQTSATRMSSDYRDDLEGITSGAAKYQLVGTPSQKDPTTDANVVYQRMEILFRVHHKLNGAERSYTEGDLLDDLAAMVDPDFYRALAACYDQPEDAEFSYEVDRTGAVVSFEVSTSVLVEPA